MVAKHTTLAKVLFAIGGNAGIAVANLILALLMLRYTAVFDYGFYALLQLTLGLATGIGYALFISPLLILLNNPLLSSRAVSAFFLANLVFCLLFAGVQAVVATAFSVNWPITLLAALSGFLMLWRAFGRGYCQNKQLVTQAIVSDTVTSISLLIGALLLLVLDKIELVTMLMLLTLAAVLGLLSLGRDFWLMQLRGFYNADWQAVRLGYQQQGKAALVGTVTAEASTNSHSYLVALLLGPAAFAPIAAAALLLRPVAVIQQSLLQTERPGLRQAILQQDQQGCAALMRRFYLIATIALLLNAILVFIVAVGWPQWLWQDADTLWQWQLACLFYGVLSALRLWRTAKSAFLQAADQFSALARVTVISALCCLPITLLLLMLFGAVWSMLAIIAAEILIVVLISGLYNQQQQWTAKSSLQGNHDV